MTVRPAAAEGISTVALAAHHRVPRSPRQLHRSHAWQAKLFVFLSRSQGGNFASSVPIA